MSSLVGLKICAITAGIKKQRSIIKKRQKKKHYETVLLVKTNLNTVEVIIFETLNCSYISCDEFFSVNNAPREFNDTKEKIKNIKTVTVNQIF